MGGNALVMQAMARSDPATRNLNVPFVLNAASDVATGTASRKSPPPPSDALIKPMRYLAFHMIGIGILELLRVVAPNFPSSFRDQAMLVVQASKLDVGSTNSGVLALAIRERLGGIGANERSALRRRPAELVVFSAIDNLVYDPTAVYLHCSKYEVATTFMQQQQPSAKDGSSTHSTVCALLLRRVD